MNKPKLTFEYVTSPECKAVGPDWENKWVLVFHLANPNGAVAAKKASDAEIYSAVEGGLLPSGAALAYGAMSNRELNRLMELANLSPKFVKRPYLDACIADLIDAARAATNAVAAAKAA